VGADPKQPQLDWAEMLGRSLHLLMQFWKLWLLVGLLLAARGALWVYRERRIARSGIEQIDLMDGISFERRLVWLFRSLGYRVEHTGQRGDYGADLVVSKAGVRMVVQAKRWSRNVGIRAVQEAHSAPALYGCSRALVVTNRHFTEPAKKLARANGVELWDRDRLVAALLTAGS
jgi:restriction system protein